MSAPSLLRLAAFPRPSALASSSRVPLSARHAGTRSAARAPRSPSSVCSRRAYSQQQQQTPPDPKLNPSHSTSSGERDRATVGVFTPKAAALFVLTGAALFLYFRNEKEKLIEQRRKEREDQAVGRPQVGGPFTLTTHKGEPFTDKDLLGKWSLIYFGFTNCPDICPEELDKMSAAVDKLDAEYGPIVQPIFISVDPARDSVEQVARYVAEFHPRLVGLTGDYATLKATCKAYRVYFSTPPDAKATDDYLVDHSIFFYFMDPHGKFVDAFGKATTEAEVVERVKKEVARWEGEYGRKV
ncbi:SCO1 protein [Trametes versicolor FP-101664 SS1]|uniref:SCO1 protein n=1 Tax=Trametes versicolor (strain FP-101664) TaxID=717944 RepID=UPI0004621D85|nr:SCO1 protein [Trametes versicolor FP-101664 SS1]EIW62279.1 SCO1 protein [Trametes versicolor FP-101664 SS1]